MKIKFITLLGVILIILSTFCWVLIPVLPFMFIPVAWKTAAVPALLILAEVLFWAGAALAGKDTVTKFITRFHPLKWFRKEKD